jgi:hypothetical protein
MIFQKDRAFKNLFKMIFFTPGSVRVQQLGASVGHQSGLHPVGRLRERHPHSHQVLKTLEHLRHKTGTSPFPELRRYDQK